MQQTIFVVASNGLPIPSLVPTRFNVYLRDRLAQSTTLVSANTNGVAGGNGGSFPVALSTNGQFALFESSASDFVGHDTNNATDVYLRDLVAGTIVLLSAATNQLTGNRPSRNPVMTPDGRFVAFVSEASNSRTACRMPSGKLFRAATRMWGTKPGCKTLRQRRAAGFIGSIFSKRKAKR